MTHAHHKVRATAHARTAVLECQPHRSRGVGLQDCDEGSPKAAWPAEGQRTAVPTRCRRGANAMFPCQVPSPGQMWLNAIVLSSAYMHVTQSSTAGAYPRMPQDAPIPGAFNGAPPKPKPKPVRLQQNCHRVWERLRPHGRRLQHKTTCCNMMQHMTRILEVSS